MANPTDHTYLDALVAGMGEGFAKHIVARLAQPIVGMTEPDAAAYLATQELVLEPAIYIVGNLINEFIIEPASQVNRVIAEVDQGVISRCWVQ
jgi:hypothetical protein